MRRTLFTLLLVVAGCGGGAGMDAGTNDAGSLRDGGSRHDAGHARDAATAVDASTDAGAATPDAGPLPVTADAVLARLGDCARIGGDYKTDNEPDLPENIPVCGDSGVVWWLSDMDIDCDGGRETTCTDDPWYLPETSATDSSGDPLDANTLPFVVIPLPSSRFRFADHDIALGQVALVIYEGRMAWAVFGDEGPSGIIGEGSYALAEELGIDPDPATGGADSGVTFVIFTGDAARVTHNEDHDEAVRVGEAAARAFLDTAP